MTTVNRPADIVQLYEKEKNNEKIEKGKKTFFFFFDRCDRNDVRLDQCGCNYTVRKSDGILLFSRLSDAALPQTQLLFFI
jgi:hypothetical protein